MKPIKSRIETYVVITLVGTTLAITPNIGFDSFNAPKLMVLVVGGITSFVLIIAASQVHKEFIFQPYSIAFLLFFASLTSTLFFSSAPIVGQIFGTFGRSSGYLAYVTLILMSYIIIIIWSENFEIKLVYGLLIAGTINLIYALLQSFELDLFKWGNVASPIFGTFGNANFLSAFLGITSIVALALLFDSKIKKLHLRLFLVCKIFLSQIVILYSTSNQGTLIFLISSSIIIYYRFLRNLGNKLFKVLYTIFVATCLLIGLFGVLNFGPLARYLFQLSTQLRGDYWRAGWSMGLDHPIFGVGLDGYGTWWLKYRDQAAILRAPDVTSNAAHNVFIDMLANGGIPLFLSHLVMFVLVSRFAILNLKKSIDYRAPNVAIASAWFAFFTQSIVSIFQLGLTTWGWAFMGLIVGRHLKTLTNGKLSSEKGRAKVVSKVKTDSEENYVFIGIPAIAIAIAISIWPLRQDFIFKTATKTNQIVSLNKSINTFPRNDFYAVIVARTYLSSKLYEEARNAAQIALKSNPNNYIALELITKNPLSDTSQINSAKMRMKILNPTYG